MAVSGTIFMKLVLACQFFVNISCIELHESMSKGLFAETGVHNPPSPSAVVKERVELYPCTPSRLSWSVLG